MISDEVIIALVKQWNLGENVQYIREGSTVILRSEKAGTTQYYCMQEVDLPKYSQRAIQMYTSTEGSGKFWKKKYQNHSWDTACLNRETKGELK